MALGHGVLNEADLLDLNDWTLLDRLQRSGVPGVASLIARLQRRDLLKRGYVVSAQTVGSEARAALVRRFHESRQERGRAEAELAAALHRPVEDVIIYCPALTVMKEAGARVTTSRGLRRLNDRDAAASAEIGALEDRYANLWRLYVFVPAEVAEAAAHAAAQLFGYPSEHVARGV